jgi:multisubunit Na+/H+ antiporter MnhG subunit
MREVSYLALLGILVGVSIFMASLWTLDAMMWYDHAWIYIPFIMWNVKVGKGEFVNVLYYALVFSLILTALSSYALGRSASTRSSKCYKDS